MNVKSMYNRRNTMMNLVTMLAPDVFSGDDEFCGDGVGSESLGDEISNDNGSGEGQGPHGPGQTGRDDERQTGLLLKPRPKTKKPSMYKVLLLNDDYTPMEFVVHILERFFSKTRQEATDIMLHVHRRGVGICGIFTYEVAETKVAQVMDFARANEQPLQCTMEKE